MMLLTLFINHIYYLDVNQYCFCFCFINFLFRIISYRRKSSSSYSSPFLKLYRSSTRRRFKFDSFISILSRSRNSLLLGLYPVILANYFLQFSDSEAEPLEDDEDELEDELEEDEETDLFLFGTGATFF